MQKVTDPSILERLNSSPARQSPSQPSGQQPVFIPNRAGQRADQRDETRTDIAVDSSQRDARREVRDIGNTQFDQTVKLSDQYNRDPTIAGYRESLGNFATALKTGDNPQGDNALITAYVKVFDPGSVVNEGEREGVASSQGALNNLIEKAKRDFGMTDSGMFTPEARKRIRSEMINIMGKRVKGYNQRREYFGQQAQAFNLDPTVIIGGHDADPLVPLFQEYDQANGLGEFAPGQQRRGKIPGATADNLAFDIDQGTGAFGSQIEAPRLNPQQQAALDAFLKANAGNPNFGPEQLTAFYQSVGIQGGAMPGDDKFYEAVRSGQGFGTQPNYAAADEQAKRLAMEASLAEAPEGTDLSTVGMEKGLLLNMTDELRGGIGGVRSMLGGEGFMSGYQSERDIERALQERAREQSGILPELVGGLMTPAGMLSRGNMARDAAGMGAIAGFGEGEGLQDSLAKGATGAGIGYGAGKALDVAAPIVANSAIGQRVGQALGGGKEARAKFAEAAERQDIDYMMADAPGGFASKMLTGISGMTLGGIPLKAAATKILDKAGQAKEQIASRIGRVPADDAATGQGIQRGLNAWEAKTQKRGAEFFDRIPIKPDAPVDLANTRAALGELNNPTASNPEMSELLRDPKLAKYQQALENGNLSWADTKAFRSRIGEQAGRPAFQQDASKDSLDALYGALTRDIETAASAHSPQAKEAFLRANRYWRGRETRREDVLSQLIGKDRNMSAEATTQQLERWAKEKGGDFNKLARAVRSLPDDEANATRAYVLDRLGATNRTKMDGTTEEAFSPAVFMQQWGKISPRAKAVLFQGEHRKALDDLETVFSGMRASNTFGNPSGTGYSVWGASNATLAGFNPVGFAMSAVGQLGSGLLLGSPRVAKWFVGLSKKPNPSAALAHIGQLSAVARAEPVIANDIFTLQEVLAKEFSRSPGAAAAEDSGDGRGVPPAQGERSNAP